MAQNEDQGSPEVTIPASRKQRLWLGYSHESLRDYSPEHPASLSRTGQVEGHGTTFTSERDHANPQDRHGDDSKPRPRSSRGYDGGAQDGEEEYTVPDGYENLDELAAPSPFNPQAENREPRLEDRSDVTPPDEEKHLPPSRRERASKIATELYTISYLVLFSIMGTLARLGLQALTFYPGAPVQTGVLWANMSGSLILGFLAEDQKLFREEWGNKPRTKDERLNDEERQRNGHPGQPVPVADQSHSSIKKTIPLYIGLAIGFCGSFTSFSSFIRDAFYALANALPVPVNHPSSAPISTALNVHRNPGYSFMAVSAVLILTVCLSLGGLQVGAHLAVALEPITPSISFYFARKFVDRTVVFLAWGCWLGAIFMSIFPPDRPNGSSGKASWSQEIRRGEALFALVFAPLGCLLRFYASLQLNNRIKSFPLGTFSVNISGTALEAMFIVLQRAPVGGMIGCQVLQGMEDGFCGCLTTVSTWVAELKALRRRHSYVYAGSSMGVGLALMVIIAGSLMWTQGFKDALCVT